MNAPKAFLSVMLAATAAAASADIGWISDTYDFGIIREAAGPQTGSLSFVNRGPEPTAIVFVRPSCGCTTAGYTEGTIQPGDTATVTFTYNPKGRPGRFEKNIKVTYGEDRKISVLHLKGTVLGTPETLFSEFPVEAGDMRVSESRLEAGTVRYGTARHLFLRACNPTEDTLYPTFTSTSPALSVEASADSLPPGETLSVSVYFNSRDTDGPQELTIPITVSDGVSTRLEVPFHANIVPDATSLTAEEVDNGPRIYLLPDLVDLGTVDGNKTGLDVEFAISNEGASPLKISRIYSHTSGVKPTSYPTVLQPGKKGKAKLRLDLEEIATGPHSLRVEIVSNDPLNPVRILRIALEKK